MKPRVEIRTGDPSDLILTNSEGVEKKVGEIFDRTLVTQRDPSKHIMRKWDAYGFNKVAIDSGFFDMVVLLYPDNTSGVISVQDIKSFGRVDSSMNEEEQYFVEARKIEKI